MTSASGVVSIAAFRAARHLLGWNKTVACFFRELAISCEIQSRFPKVLKDAAQARGLWRSKGGASLSGGCCRI